MTQRRRKRNPIDAAVVLITLLYLIGVAFISFWKSLPGESQIFFLIAGGILILTGTGALIMVAVYKKRQRALIWRRAMAGWMQSSKDGRNPNIPEIHAARQFSPYELERFAAQVYSKMGYRVVHTGRSGDHGVDVRLINPNGQVEIVQCKQWNSQVGEPDVRNLVGSMVHEKAVRGYLWAPGGFTVEARWWAKGKPVVLMDEREIGRIVGCILPQKRGI